MVDEAAVDKIIAGLKSERKTRKPLIEPLPDPDKLARLPRPDGLDHARGRHYGIRKKLAAGVISPGNRVPDSRAAFARHRIIQPAFSMAVALMFGNTRSA